MGPVTRDGAKWGRPVPPLPYHQATQLWGTGPCGVLLMSGKLTEVNPQWEWGAWWPDRPPAVGNERKTALGLDKLDE